MTNSKKDTRYITLLSVISAFGVIVLHTNDHFWSYTEGIQWKSANIINAIFYSAVPLFFMISGATLMDYRERYNTKKFAEKRFKKTVIPFLVWGFFGLLCYLFYRKKVVISAGTLSYIFVQVVNWYPNPYGTYWFLGELFIVYATIPLLSLVPKEKRKTLFTYLAVICFVSQSLIPFITSHIPFFSTSLSFVLGGKYVFYAVVGYLIKEYEPNRKQEIILYILALTGFITQIVGTYYLSVRDGELNDRYKGYFNVAVVVLAVGIFVFFRKYGNNIMNVKPLGKLVSFLGNYTFGIYLLHWNVMYFFGKLILNYPNGFFIYRFIGPFVVMPICVLIVFILRKIPFIKYLVP